MISIIEKKAAREKTAPLLCNCPRDNLRFGNKSGQVKRLPLVGKLSPKATDEGRDIVIKNKKGGEESS